MFVPLKADQRLTHAINVPEFSDIPKVVISGRKLFFWKAQVLPINCVLLRRKTFLQSNRKKNLSEMGIEVARSYDRHFEQSSSNLSRAF